MNTHSYAVVFAVEADDYESALNLLQDALESAEPQLFSVDGLESGSVVVDYEYDNDDQRVLYLPPEDDPENSWLDEDDAD